MRKLIVTSLLLAFSMAAFAQSTKWIVGLESTITSSSIRQSSDYDIYQSQTGYGAAVAVSYQLTPYLWLSSGLGLERKGNKVGDFVFTDMDGFIPHTTEAHRNFDYLILPRSAEAPASVDSILGRLCLQQGIWFKPQWRCSGWAKYRVRFAGYQLWLGEQYLVM